MEGGGKGLKQKSSHNRCEHKRGSSGLYKHSSVNKRKGKFLRISNMLSNDRIHVELKK